MPRANAEFGIQWDGLDQFRRTLKAANDALPKEMAKANQQAGATFFVPEARRRAAGRTNPRPGHKVIDSIKANRVQSGVVVQMGRNSVPWAVGHEFGSNRFKQFPVRSSRYGRGNAGYFFYPAIRATRDKIQTAYGEVLDRLMKQAFPD